MNKSVTAVGLDARAVTCLFCGAKPGDPCTTLIKKSVLPTTHSTRIDDYLRSKKQTTITVKAVPSSGRLTSFSPNTDVSKLHPVAQNLPAVQAQSMVQMNKNPQINDEPWALYHSTHQPGDWWYCSLNCLTSRTPIVKVGHPPVGTKCSVCTNYYLRGLSVEQYAEEAEHLNATMVALLDGNKDAWNVFLRAIQDTKVANTLAREGEAIALEKSLEKAGKTIDKISLPPIQYTRTEAEPPVQRVV